jgi:retron-type reverse transcriptase
MARANGSDRKAAREPALGAASRVSADWHQIDWKQCARNVSRLQARIVKAIEDGRWNRARALQRLLTHSFSGRALAVKRVTENRGKRTPGIDGTTWRTPAQKETAVHELRRRGYRAQPLRRVYIEKSGRKAKRPLGIPVMKDRAMQALHLLGLAPIGEVLGDENSYGFRPGRSAADALRKCHALLARRDQARWVLEGDIRSCFDEINHDWLLEHIPMDQQILQKWLTAGFMDKSALHPSRAGTPQGGVASPVLANMTLDGLQARLRECFPVRRCRAQNRVHLVRYADLCRIRHKSAYAARLVMPHRVDDGPRLSVNGHEVLLVGGRLHSRSADSRNPGGRTVVLVQVTRLVRSAAPSFISPSPGLWAVWSTPWVVQVGWSGRRHQVGLRISVEPGCPRHGTVHSPWWCTETNEGIRSAESPPCPRWPRPGAGTGPR